MKKSRLLVLAALIAVLVLSAGCALAYTILYFECDTGKHPAAFFYAENPTSVLTSAEAEDHYPTPISFTGFVRNEGGQKTYYSFGDPINLTENISLSPYTATEITASDIKLSAETFTYNGQEQTPTVTVTVDGTTLVENTDYTITWPSDYKYAGEKTIKVTGAGAYTGTPTKTYKIQKLTLNDTSVSLSAASVVWDGEKTYDKPTVTVKSGDCTISAIEYSVDYGDYDYTKVGLKKIVVTPVVDNLSGSVTKDFKINYKLTLDDVTPKTFTGGTFKPTVTTSPDLEEGGIIKFTCELDKTYRFKGCNAGNPTGSYSELDLNGWVGILTYDPFVNASGYEMGKCSQSGETPTLKVYSLINAATVTSNCSETSATITWSNPDTAVQKYDVYLDGSFYATIPASTPSCTFTQLEAGSTHSFAIDSIYTTEGTEVDYTFTTYEGGSFTTLSTGTGTTEKIPVESFKVGVSGKKNLNGKTLKLEAGKQRKLIVSAVRPKNATNLKMRYHSSNTAVCTVKNGMLVAKKAGTATITVTARSNSAAKVVFKVKVK